MSATLRNQVKLFRFFVLHNNRLHIASGNVFSLRGFIITWTQTTNQCDFFFFLITLYILDHFLLAMRVDYMHIVSTIISLPLFILINQNITDLGLPF